MNKPSLVLKQSTGWFAAGREFGQALELLSDAGFRLYAWLCLHADRHTGQLQTNVTTLGLTINKPVSWIESTVGELLERGVCVWADPEVLEVADPYWPYEKQRCRTEAKDYLDAVRRMLQVPACVRCRFTSADERLAQDLARRGVTVEQLQRAIWLGCARKYLAMLNGQPPMPIASLRYFVGLVEEVSQANTPESYWHHVRSKTDRLERQWLQQSSRRAVPQY
jgi:hypothetical protein